MGIIPLYKVMLAAGAPEAKASAAVAVLPVGEKLADKADSPLAPVLVALGAMAAIVTMFFQLRRLFHWWFPIRIFPSIRVVFDESGPDQIVAAVTNVSGEDQVLVRCSARSVYPIRTALLKHLKRPLTPPRLYPTIWYAPVSFDLMGNKPIRLKPKARRELSHSLSNHPLSLFLTAEIRVETQLSERRRIFRSGRIRIPERWQLKPSR